MNHLSPSVQNLLINFKSIVELVMKFPGDSLTSQYGAIERIRSAILSILSHGLKQKTGDMYEQLWQLVVRLNSNSEKYIYLLQDIYHKENIRTSVEQWIDQSMITQCLSRQLFCIENDIDLLENYYYSYAFMRILPFYHAFMTCICTVESSNSSLLANIDPKLSIVGLDHSTNEIMYRSYSSTIPPATNKNNNITKAKLSFLHSQEKPSPIAKQRILHRRIHSDPIFYFGNSPENRSSMTSSLIVNQEESEPNISYSCDYGTNEYSRTDSIISIEQSLPMQSSHPSLTRQITIIDEDDDQFYQSKRLTNASDINQIECLPNSSLFWPRKGQTLDNYIREYDSHTQTDVEKENAHFYFSEAIISAIEYVKFSEKCKKYFHSSDENFITLNNFKWFEPTSNSNSEDLSSEAIALAIMETWKSYKIPTASKLFWMIPHEEEMLEELTPLQDRKTTERSDEFPRVEGSQRILRRGNSQWAPPREQLIFHIHQSVNRDSQLKKQGHLCAGCGREAEKGYAHRYRYCEYTGKYFCRSCHSDEKFYLPSYIITKWDFSNKHSVSNFAFDYLNRIFTEAIFNINDLNPKLFEKSNKLRLMNELRWALYFLRYYILTCRFAEEQGYQKILQTLPTHIYEQPCIYSLEDLVKTKLGELHKVFEPIIVNLRNHVLACSLCYAKGFICEICKEENHIIFPFNTQITSTCAVCQSCFHIQCHKNNKYQCPKCQRAKQRHFSDLTSPSRTNTPTNA